MNSVVQGQCKVAAHEILWYHGKAIPRKKLMEVVDYQFIGYDELSPVDCAGAYELVAFMVSEARLDIKLPDPLER